MIAICHLCKKNIDSEHDYTFYIGCIYRSELVVTHYCSDCFKSIAGESYCQNFKHAIEDAEKERATFHGAFDPS